MKIVSSLERDSAIRRARAVKYLQQIQNGKNPDNGPSGWVVVIVLTIMAATYIVLKITVG